MPQPKEPWQRSLHLLHSDLASQNFLSALRIASAWPICLTSLHPRADRTFSTSSHNGVRQPDPAGHTTATGHSSRAYTIWTRFGPFPGTEISSEAECQRTAFILRLAIAWLIHDVCLQRQVQFLEQEPLLGCCSADTFRSKQTFACESSVEDITTPTHTW